MSQSQLVVTLSIKSAIRDLRPIIDVQLDHPKPSSQRAGGGLRHLSLTRKLYPKVGQDRQTTYATYQLNHQSKDVFGMWNKER